MKRVPLKKQLTTTALTAALMMSTALVTPRRALAQEAVPSLPWDEGFDASKHAYDIKKIELTKEQYEAAISSGAQDVFAYSETDETGKLTTSYYQIELKSDLLEEGTADDSLFSFKQTQEDGTVNTVYYKYAGTLPTGTTSYYIGEDATEQTGLLNNSDNHVAGADIHGADGPESKGVLKDFKITTTKGSSYNNRNNFKEGLISNSNTSSQINNIYADFINNSISVSQYSTLQGGMVHNSGMITSINGNFVDNRVTRSSSSYAYSNGDLIYNKGTIGTINGNFISNSSSVSNSDKGMIYNDKNGRIDKIAGSFIGNSMEKGTLIYNKGGNIGDISGTFIGNNVSYLIYNNNFYDSSTKETIPGIINSISGDFIGNSFSSSLIYSYGDIPSINGNFIGNTYVGSYSGSVLSINSEVEDISGNFISNNALAVSIDEPVGSINGSFISNKGAIENFYASVREISGTFVKNSYSFGGAISNSPGGSGSTTIGKINGTFIANSVSGINSYRKTQIAVGGAIGNGGGTSWAEVSEIAGLFQENVASATGEGSQALGGAIGSSPIAYTYYYSTYSASIGKISGDFIQNKAEAETAKGGAIYLLENKNRAAISGSFSKNTAFGQTTAQGGAIGLDNTSAVLQNASFMENSSSVEGNGIALGGAIFNLGGDITLTDSSFTGNYASVGEGGTALGGAIYSGGVVEYIYTYVPEEGTVPEAVSSVLGEGKEEWGETGYGNIQINANQKDVVFTGNKTVVNGVVMPNDIYIDGRVVQSTKANGLIFKVIADDDLLEKYKGTMSTSSLNTFNRYVELYKKGEGGKVGSSTYSLSGIVSRLKSSYDNSVYSFLQDEGLAEEVMGRYEDDIRDLMLNASSDRTISFNSGIDGNLYTVNINTPGQRDIISAMSREELASILMKQEGEIYQEMGNSLLGSSMTEEEFRKTIEMIKSQIEYLPEEYLEAYKFIVSTYESSVVYGENAGTIRLQDSYLRGAEKVSVNGGTFDITTSEVEAKEVEFASGTTFGVTLNEDDTSGTITANKISIGDNVSAQVLVSFDAAHSGQKEYEVLTATESLTGTFADTQINNNLFDISYESKENAGIFKIEWKEAKPEEPEEPEKPELTPKPQSEKEYAEVEAAWFGANEYEEGSRAKEIVDDLFILAQKDDASFRGKLAEIAPSKAPVKMDMTSIGVRYGYKAALGIITIAETGRTKAMKSTLSLGRTGMLVRT